MDSLPRAERRRIQKSEWKQLLKDIKAKEKK
jgi:hypothetical protein